MQRTSNRIANTQPELLTKTPKLGNRQNHKQTGVSERSFVWGWSQSRKTREGCGCPKFPAGKVFRQISTLLENDSPIFRQREMLSLPRFGHFPATKTAAGKLAAPAGTLLDFSPSRLPQPSWVGAHLRTPALKTANFSKKIGRFSKTRKWIY